MEKQDYKSKWDDLVREIGAEVTAETEQRSEAHAPPAAPIVREPEEVATHAPLPKKSAVDWADLAGELGLPPVAEEPPVVEPKQPTKAQGPEVVRAKDSDNAPTRERQPREGGERARSEREPRQRERGSREEGGQNRVERVSRERGNKRSRSDEEQQEGENRESRGEGQSRRGRGRGGEQSEDRRDEQSRDPDVENKETSDAGYRVERREERGEEPSEEQRGGRGRGRGGRGRGGSRAQGDRTEQREGRGRTSEDRPEGERSRGERGRRPRQSQNREPRQPRGAAREHREIDIEESGSIEASVVQPQPPAQEPAREQPKSAAVSLWHKIFGMPSEPMPPVQPPEQVTHAEEAGYQSVEFSSEIDEEPSTVEVRSLSGDEVAAAGFIDEQSTEDVAAEAAEEEQTERKQNRSRRRRRGGRGRRSGERRREEQSPDQLVHESAGSDDLNAGFDDLGDDEQLVGVGTSSDDEDDDGTTSHDSRAMTAAQRAIPSWDDAIGFIVDSNMAGRSQRRPPARPDSRGAGRGRPRGGGRRK